MVDTSTLMMSPSFQDLVFIGDSMAYDIVDGCTYAFGKSLIIKGRRDTAVLSGIVVYQPINLFRTHAFTDMAATWSRTAVFKSALS